MNVSRSEVIIRLVGIIALSLWVIDAYGDIVQRHHPEILLWYSLMGLLLTGVALVSGSTYLVSAMFCALFIPEAVWSIGFLSMWLWHLPLGIADYVFKIGYPRHDLFVSLYHMLMPISLLGAVCVRHRFEANAWKGAALFGMMVIGLTYCFGSQSDATNCLWQVGGCQAVVGWLYPYIDLPWRAFIGSGGLILLCYLPTNYVGRWLGLKLHLIDQ